MIISPGTDGHQEANVDGCDSLEQLAGKLAGLPLTYQPGTQWVCSFAHHVQARLVEVLSDISFETPVYQATVD